MSRRHPQSTSRGCYLALATAAAAWTAAAPALAQDSLPGSCTVSLLNQVANVQPDGSWDIPNVPANMGPVRARLTCLDDGQTAVGASGFFTITANRMNAISRIELGAGVATPVAIALSLPAPLLTAAGQTEQATVTATFSDGSLLDVTAAAAGTAYSTTNPAVATVAADGLVTAVASGRVLILALHEAIFDSLAVTVLLGGDSDGDGLPDDFELANGLDPNDPVDALEDRDRDGLGNRSEFELGTDLGDGDTDGDGIGDGEEVAAGDDGFVTSPLLADSDGDGVRDPLEIDFGTDPSDPASVDYGPLLLRLTTPSAAFTLVNNTIFAEAASRRLRIDGHLVDGTVVDLTARGTSFVSTDLTVASFGSEPGRIFAGNDGTAAVIASHSGFEIGIEVTVTTFSPRALSFLAIPGFANGVAVDGDYAYVAAGATGLQVVDVSDPEAPFIAGSVDTPGNANDVRAAGTLVYVADGEAGLQVIDASTPTDPVIVGSADTPGEATDLVVDGERVYVADGPAGMSVIDAGVAAAPVWLGAVDTPGNARGIDAGGGFVVVADAAGGVHVIDVSDPAAPLIVGSTHTRGSWSRAADVAVSGRRAWVADGSDKAVGGLRTVDFGTPATPVVIGASANSFGLAAVALDRSLALAADFLFFNAVPAFDVDQPAPAFRQAIDFRSFSDANGHGIAVQSGLLYMVGGDALADNRAAGVGGLHIARYARFGVDGGSAPTVEITAPAAGDSVFARRLLSVRAVAADDVQVGSVELFADGEPVAKDSTAPYELEITAPTEPGTLILGAVATDLAGHRGFAEEVAVTVLPDPTPTVRILAPLSASRVTEGTLLPIAVVATANVDVDRVFVFADGGLVWISHAPSFRFDLPVPMGASELTLTAEAFNVLGESATSEPVIVGVDPDEPPFVTILAPLGGAEVVEETTVHVVAGASDDFGVAAVEFFVDGLPVSEDFADPYELDLAVPLGSSQLTVSAVAVDNAGQDAASPDVTLTVIPDPGTTIVGSVVLDDGSPAVGATVSALGLGISTTTGGAGGFLLAGIPTILGPITVEAALDTGAGTLGGLSATVDPVPGAVLDVGAIVISNPLVIGIAGDSANDSAIVFNGESDSAFGTVALASDVRFGDCSVIADRSLGFVADGALASRIWVIDLSFPPSLAAGTNPIELAARASDTALTPDDRFLVVCEGSAASVFDTASRDQVDTLALGVPCAGVDACDDGSVPIATAQGSTVRRLTIDGSGALTDTGESLAAAAAVIDVFCSPAAPSGIAVTFQSDQILSFTFPGLALQDARSLAGFRGRAGAAHPAGDRIFVRDERRDDSGAAVGAVEVFAFDSTTGAIGAEPLLTIPTSPSKNTFGAEQIALHPDGSKLYVTEPGAISVYDASTGALLTQIATPGSSPLGICLARAP